jgi:hypothetical protein
MTPACHGNSQPFDVLIDHSQGAEHRAAVREAWAMCRECPLLAACHAENAGEPWVWAIYDTKFEAVDRPECGTSKGVKAHRIKGEKTCEKCRRYMREAKAKRHRRVSVVAA